MNLELVDRIVNALLYEGYILYPYRPSAVKNSQRWNFGAIMPKAYSQAQQGSDDCRTQTECLVQASQHTTVNVRLRFLHLLARQVGTLNKPPLGPSGRADPDFQVVASLSVDDKVFHTWQEAIERDLNTPMYNLSDLVACPERLRFDFGATQEREELRDSREQVVGIVMRAQECIEGAIEISVEPVADQLFKLRVQTSNLTPMEGTNPKLRDELLMQSLVSTHTILSVQRGDFISLLDPPGDLREHAAACKNIGCWPVLVGEEHERDCLLSSPIVLYDYPQIAPESPGNFFDSTEIDELLTLRLLTLTDEEKREMRNVDVHSRQLLDRTEVLPPEQLAKLHGALRGLRPAAKDNQ